MSNFEKQIYTIVLTGGPCGGKTTALRLLEEALLRANYEVINVEEAATTIISSGVIPNDSTVNMEEFQKLILRKQLFNEELFKTAMYKTNKPLVIILDRGAVDGKAYVENMTWKKVLKEESLDEISLYARYDLVLHLVTAAIGAEEAYTTANNSARRETLDEAKVQDDLTRRAWNGHNNLKFIDNKGTFKEKMQKVIEHIFRYLDKSIPEIKQEKYLVEIPNNEVISKLNAVSRNISQTYLTSKDKEERRIRKIGVDGSYAYYYTVKSKDGSFGVKEVRIDHKIYNMLLSEKDPNTNTIEKVRWYFSKDFIYYNLDVFDGNESVGILELRRTNKTDNMSILDEIKVISNISLDEKYKNYNLSNVNCNLL